jgi:hypothetical protein
LPFFCGIVVDIISMGLNLMNPNDFFNNFSTSNSMEIKKGRMVINILFYLAQVSGPGLCNGSPGFPSFCLFQSLAQVPLPHQLRYKRDDIPQRDVISYTFIRAGCGFYVRPR